MRANRERASHDVPKGEAQKEKEIINFVSLGQ